MSRPRGRPTQGAGVSREGILAAALELLEEGGGKGLSMRALAARLGVTPMSLYHHVQDHAALLRALSDRIYGEVMDGQEEGAAPLEVIRGLLCRYHDAVGRHPQLTLAIFSEPAAFAGVSRQITDYLMAQLAAITSEPVLWRDILVDHAHGSGLALASARGRPGEAPMLSERYRQALDRLLARLSHD